MPSPLASDPAAADRSGDHRGTTRQGGDYRRAARSVEHLTDPVGVVVEEPGRLVDRLGLPNDLTAHPARPSRRSASSCGTYEVCPAASRERQSASAALSSASSSSCGCYQPITLFALSAWGWRRRE